MLVTTTQRDVGFPRKVGPHVDIGAVEMQQTEPSQTSGKIEGAAFQDNNGNGLLDAGESGFAGLPVNLLNSSNTLTAVTVTDSSGHYQFNQVPIGMYRVTFGQPTGYNFSQPYVGNDPAVFSDVNSSGVTNPFTLSAGQDQNNVNAGLRPQTTPTVGTIDGRAFEDDNSNGILDSGEPGFGGVTVGLYNSSGALVNSTMTTADGYYEFTQLAAGSYYAVFSLPLGYVFSPEYQGSNPQIFSDVDGTGTTAQFTLASGQNRDFLNVGLALSTSATGTIHGTAFKDNNGNGIKDSGEPGFGAVTVSLCNSNGALIATTVASDTDGSYQFNLVPAGVYSVVFGQPDGWSFSPEYQGSDPTVYSDADSTGTTAQFTLATGQTLNYVNAGLVPPPTGTASVAGTAFQDSNGNGIKDSGESGFATISVSLCNSSGTVVASTTTDANGHYQFTQLPAGNYAVVFSQQDGYTFSPEYQGSDPTVYSDVDSTGTTALFTLTAGQVQNYMNAGFVPVTTTGTATIEGQAFRDANGDGIHQTAELAFSGLVVNLYNSAGSLIASTVTDSTGHYQFTLLPPGNYYLVFQQPLTYSFSPEYQGSDPTAYSDVDSSGTTALFTLAAAQDQNYMNAGLAPSSGSGQGANGQPFP
jgi:hypothetical protein